MRVEEFMGLLKPERSQLTLDQTPDKLASVCHFVRFHSLCYFSFSYACSYNISGQLTFKSCGCQNSSEQAYHKYSVQLQTVQKPPEIDDFVN